MIEYIEFLRAKHRATLHALYDKGKTYRSRFVARERGYLEALQDIEDVINQPQKNAELQETMREFAQRFKG